VVGRPKRRSMPRIASITATFDCWSPWLMLIRNASAPAWNSAAIISALLLAGPSVASTRTLRERGPMLVEVEVMVVALPGVSRRPL